MKTLTILLTTLLFITIAEVQAQINSPISNPLDGFAPFIGGEWHLDGTLQVFEWGIGNKSVRSRSYFVINGERKLVSEGYWFWHPGEKVIKGFFTAINMPVNFFEYTSEFSEGTLVSQLVSYDNAGNPTTYKETMNPTSGPEYVWKLYQGQAEIMGGTFTKTE